MSSDPTKIDDGIREVIQLFKGETKPQARSSYHELPS